jgi:hypothetical protein
VFLSNRLQERTGEVKEEATTRMDREGGSGRTRNVLNTSGRVGGAAFDWARWFGLCNYAMEHQTQDSGRSSISTPLLHWEYLLDLGYALKRLTDNGARFCPSTRVTSRVAGSKSLAHGDVVVKSSV